MSLWSCSAAAWYSPLSWSLMEPWPLFWMWVWAFRSLSSNKELAMLDHSYGLLFCPSTDKSVTVVMVVSDLEKTAEPPLWFTDTDQSFGLTHDKAVAVISCNLTCLVPPSFCRRHPVCSLTVLSQSSGSRISSTPTNLFLDNEQTQNKMCEHEEDTRN